MVVGSLNINSLMLHVDEIHTILKEKDIHFLALNETKLDDTCSDAIVNVEGYKFGRLDRNRNGGGVAFYCKDTVQCDVRNDSPRSTLELVCVEITPPKAKSYVVILWYRPPNNPMDDFDKLEQCLQFFESEGKEIILIGDTNCDLLHRDTACNLDHVIPNHVKRIVDIYDAYGLKQLITEPTRETTYTATLIDHIAVSNTNNIVESGVIKTAMSDHYLVYAIRKFQGGSKRQHKVIKTRQMKHFDENSFLQDLALIDWKTHLRSSADINSIVEKITSLISGVIQKYAPLVERRVSERYTPWISEDLKYLFKARDKIKVSAVKNKSEILMSAYRQMRNKATKMNREAKRVYFSEKLQASQGNLKETWATINKLVNKRSKTTNITALEVDGQTIDDSVGMANSMNDFFCNVGDQLSKDIPTQRMIS